MQVWLCLTGDHAGKHRILSVPVLCDAAHLQHGGAHGQGAPGGGVACGAEGTPATGALGARAGACSGPHPVNDAYRAW